MDPPAAPDPSCLRRTYQRLVDAEYLTVYRVLFWRHGDRATAEDLTQETFLRAWRGLPGRRRGMESDRAWLLTIARRVSQDHARRPAPSTLPLAEVTHRAAPGLSPEDRVAQDDEVHRLRRAVLALPEPYRSALVLTKIEALDTAQAARILGVPRGTVKWRVSRALRLLRERMTLVDTLEETDVPPPDFLSRR